LPLETLALGWCRFAKGLGVLAEIPSLKVLLLPVQWQDLPLKVQSALAALRQHPTLAIIGEPDSEHSSKFRLQGSVSGNSQTAEQFWRKIDEELRISKIMREIGDGRAQFRRRSSGWAVDLKENPVSDLSSLRGLPITQLSLIFTRVSDLEPLRGMPLTILALNRSKVTDLSALKNCPLKELYLYDLTEGIDLQPLTKIPTLEVVGLPPNPKNLDTLRGAERLRRISFEYDDVRQVVPQTAAEFWGGAPVQSMEALARAGHYQQAEKLHKETRVLAVTTIEDFKTRLRSVAAIIAAQPSTERYQKHCRELKDSYFMTTSGTAEMVARVCLVRADSGLSMQDLETLAVDARRIKPNTTAEWCSTEVTSALFEYRAGRPQKAVDSLSALTVRGMGSIKVLVNALLSMCYHDLGQSGWSKEHLSRAREALAIGWPQTEKDPKEHWSDWLIAHILVQDAARHIEPDAKAAPEKAVNSAPRKF
jgi:hypothetical protein